MLGRVGGADGRSTDGDPRFSPLGWDGREGREGGSRLGLLSSAAMRSLAGGAATREGVRSDGGVVGGATRTGSERAGVAGAFRAGGVVDREGVRLGCRGALDGRSDRSEPSPFRSTATVNPRAPDAWSAAETPKVIKEGPRSAVAITASVSRFDRLWRSAGAGCEPECEPESEPEIEGARLSIGGAPLGRSNSGGNQPRMQDGVAASMKRGSHNETLRRGRVPRIPNQVSWNEISAQGPNRSRERRGQIDPSSCVPGRRRTETQSLGLSWRSRDHVGRRKHRVKGRSGI